MTRPLLLPTYPQYKPSRVPWLDEIPAHIDLMGQYRTSLIHEVVTGARDVRKAAASIPDDPTPNPPAP